METTLSAALEREHGEIDAGLSEFATGLQGGERRSDALEQASAALRRHIYLEEEFLFPVLRQGRFVAAVMVMLREHGEIWRALDEIEAGMATGMACDELSDVYEQLVGVLGEHNEKEEAILYPAADSALGTAETARLEAFMKGGTMPANWVCHGARGPGKTNRPGAK